MKPMLLLFACFAIPALAGCDAGTTSSSDAQYIDEAPLDLSHPSFGWQEIPEPFGDESSLKYRLTPAEVVVGEPVQIEVLTGSVYGPLTDVRIMVRTTAGSTFGEDGRITNHKEGKEWTTVEPEGVYVQVYQDDETEKEVRFEPGDDGYREYAVDNSGHMRFVTSLTLTEEEPVIELRWHAPSMEEAEYWKAFADVAIQVYPERE